MKLLKFGRDELLIGFVAIFAYAICVFNDFHTDDWIVLSLIRDGLSWNEFLSMETLGRFRPVTNIVVYLRYLAFGDNPFGYYALNILLNAFTSVIFYRLLIKIELSKNISLLAALFFAVYFQHYEGVIWLYGTIRIMAAIFYIVSLWYLKDYTLSGSLKDFLKFAIVSFIGLFVVEDFVVAPIVFVAFTYLFTDDISKWKKVRLVSLYCFGALAVYFIMRTYLIAMPNVTEKYYFPGFHMFRTFFEYIGWFVIPSPDHIYFKKAADALANWVMIWKAVSYAAMIGFVPMTIWVFLKSGKQVKLFIIFMYTALLPVIPLTYKVSSRNIYLPSIGLAVLFAYLFSALLSRFENKKWLKKAGIIFLITYFTVNIISVGIASREYRITQNLVRGIVDDIKASGVDISNCEYILLDNMPGRAIVGPALIYRMNYWKNVVASNDPVYGPFNIRKEALELHEKGEHFEVFDYRNGRMVYVEDEYLPDFIKTEKTLDLTPKP